MRLLLTTAAVLLSIAAFSQIAIGGAAAQQGKANQAAGPPTAPTLYAYWEADKGLTGTTSVTQWDDQHSTFDLTGSGADGSSADTLVFADEGDNLDITTGFSVADGDETVFAYAIIFSYDDNVSSSLVSFGASGGALYQVRLVTSGTGRLRGDISDTGGGVTGATNQSLVTNLGSGVWHGVIINHGGGLQKVWDIASGTAEADATYNTDHSANQGTHGTIGSFYIGDGVGGGLSEDFDLKAVYVFSDSLDATERADWATYMNSIMP